MACKAFRNEPLPIVETDHGDYALLKKEDPEMRRHQLLLDRVDAIVCPSRANETLVRSLPWRTNLQTTVIPYAIPGTRVIASDQQRPFTFGMVSRGIAEKGWAEALSAFRLLKQRVPVPVRLLFVGEGEYLSTLKHDVGNDEGVMFAGYQASPDEWVAQFDVGLLPSYFAAESLPNAVIECLVQGKPVIATQVGGIPEMLEHEGEPCGISVPLERATGRADVSALADAMKRVLEEEDVRVEYATRALRASRRYAPEHCSEIYVDFFSNVPNHRIP